MWNGHSTEEWELGCSDPRQDISCTIVGVTTDGDGLAHQVFVHPVSHGFLPFEGFSLQEDCHYLLCLRVGIGSECLPRTSPGEG